MAILAYRLKGMSGPVYTKLDRLYPWRIVRITDWESWRWVRETTALNVCLRNYLDLS